jgi:hypothetical protein
MDPQTARNTTAVPQWYGTGIPCRTPQDTGVTIGDATGGSLLHRSIRWVYVQSRDPIQSRIPPTAGLGNGSGWQVDDGDRRCPTSPQCHNSRLFERG